MRVTAKQHFIDGLRRSASALWSRLRATGPRRAPLGVEIPLELVLEQRAEEPSLPEPPVVRDTFCVLAWNHLQIAPNGTVKMCCIASEDIHDKGRPMSLYTDTYEEIWNSE